jgi:Lytic transglycolase
MSPAALQRQAALAGAALLAVLLVVILDRSNGETSAATPPPPVARAQWETATVGIFGRSRLGDATACGTNLTPDALGVAHPVLPCGVDLIVSYRGREVRTEVIERGNVGPESQFDLSPALADELGIEKPTTIRWRFAG